MIRTYLIKRFEDAGFTYVKPPSTYAKRIAVGNIPLFLTMQVVKDRFNESRYTMEMYIAPYALLMHICRTI